MLPFNQPRRADVKPRQHRGRVKFLAGLHIDRQLAE